MPSCTPCPPAHHALLHTCAPVPRGRWAITSDDPEYGGQGNKDTGADFWGAPDLDHANPHLREALVHWLQHLRDNIGFTGWRFDFAKVCVGWLVCVFFVCWGGGGNSLGWVTTFVCVWGGTPIRSALGQTPARPFKAV
jgi:hypothetical protein